MLIYDHNKIWFDIVKLIGNNVTKQFRCNWKTVKDFKNIIYTIQAYKKDINTITAKIEMVSSPMPLI